MGKVLPSQRLLKQFEERLVFGEMNLSEIVRSGAQMMLQYALEREVTEALGRNYYENAPATTKEKGRRNGYESHRVLTGEGAVTVQVPQVRETEKVFQSKILDAYVSRTEKLDELIARMYVHGMSTRDIEATFADVLSGTGVSKSVVSRVTRCLSEDFEAFRKRDLSNEKLLYLEFDGTYLRYHQGAERKEPILVATGYRAAHKRLRTSNLLERTFGEHKRRTKVIPHFFTEEAAMKLSFAVLLAVANKWRGVRMDVFAARKVEELRNELLPQGTSEESAA